MSLIDSVLQSLAPLILERPGRKRTLAQWAQEFDRGVPRAEGRSATAKNEEAAANALRHITGIERWGQSRLRVFLGAPLQRDEYDGYAPAEGESAAAQLAALRAARSESAALIRQLEAAGVSLDAAVPHNQFGPLTVRGWLAYLHSHAEREAWRIR